MISRRFTRVAFLPVVTFLSIALLLEGCAGGRLERDARAPAVPMIPAFCVLEPDGRYTARFEKPIRVEPDDDEIVPLGRRMAGLQTPVRSHPERSLRRVELRA